MDLSVKIGRTFLKAAATAVERDRLWVSHARHGRWMVVEHGAGRRLDAPRVIKAIVDMHTPRRVRRFSSLSRARAFARLVDGEVRRWCGKRLRRVSPWEWSWRTGEVGVFTRLLGMKVPAQ